MRYRLIPIGAFLLALLGGLASAMAQTPAPQMWVDTPQQNTYAAAVNAVTAGAAATDVMCVTGSNTKIVTVWQMQITGVSTTATTTDLAVVVRSTPNTGGTAVAMTAVPMDPANTAATASAFYYTANPTTGALVGKVHADKYTFTAPTGAPANTIIPYRLGDGHEQALILRGANMSACFNMNGVTPAGSIFSGDIYWTEQ